MMLQGSISNAAMYSFGVDSCFRLADGHLADNFHIDHLHTFINSNANMIRGWGGDIRLFESEGYCII